MENNGDGLKVAVVGATGAVGRDLLGAIGRSRLPVASLQLFASMATTGETIDVDGRTHRVWSLLGSDRVPEQFDGMDLVFLAVPSAVAREYGRAIADHDVTVIDIGANLADEAPMCIPALDTGVLDGISEGRIVCSPSAPAVMLSTLLEPLVQIGAGSCSGTVLLSAGAAGRKGVEELSGQVIALFNQKDPPREIFPSGLAFDIHTQLGEAHDGWTGPERRIAIETASLTGLSPEEICLSVAMAPLFAGVLASLRIEFDHRPDLDAVRAALEAQAMVAVGDPLPGSRRLAGEAQIFVGRLRADPCADAVHLWAVCDNLRCGASANALAIATALWSDGYL
jgi:aspartate-semialdehyde dehydrogenase